MGLCFTKEKEEESKTRSVSSTPRSWIWKKDDTPHPGCVGRQFQFLVPDK